MPDQQPPIFRFKSARLYQVGLAVMLILLVMAAVFWRERSWLLDVAFQTFLMIKDGTVQVMVYRFGAATVQSLPLLGIKLGLPLEGVSWLYSVSFHLHFLAFFLGAGWWLKRQDVALAIAVLYTAMTYDGFYWQTSELQQGLGFLLFTWALLLRQPKLHQWWQYPLWAIIIIALAFYHPLVFMPFYLMLLWLWFKPAAGVPRKTVLYLGLGMMAVLVVKQIWFQNWYDAQKTANFMANLKQDFPNYLSYPAFSQFFADCLSKWWGYPIILLAVSGWLAYQKRWPALAILWLASAGFLVLNAIGDPAAEHRFYVEVNLYPLLAFVLVPLIIDIFPLFKAKTPKWLLPVVIIFFASRLLAIGLHARPYTGRVNYVRHLAAEFQSMPGQKFLVPPESLEQKTLLMDWGLCYETLIASSSDLEKSVTLLPLSNPEAKIELLQTDTLFVTPWTTFPLREVNERGYWKLEDEPYQ